MDNTYNLQVITPERIMVNEQVQMTVAPGSEGYLGILVGHASLMTTLTPGEVTATLADGRTTSHIVISGGFMEVSPEGTVILADSAERSDEIDVNRAEADLAEARRMVAELTPGSPEAIQALNDAQHAEARIRAGRSSTSWRLE
jgi:F-type H+-transporting ATPase subunit epsilon